MSMATHGAQINSLDPRSLNDIRRLTRIGGEGGVNSNEALRAASKQAEAMFLQIMLKSMRDATPSNSLLDNDQTRMIQALHDQQLASNLAQSKGIGLADALFRQLGGEPGGKAGGVGTKAPLALAAPPVSVAESAVHSAKIAATIDAAREAAGSVPEHVRDFVASVWPHAQAASRATGIPAHFMVAQAALETGWGAKQPKNADGTPSHNLFNIKAGPHWSGPSTATLKVAEYDAGNGNGNGHWQTRKSAFRSYASYAEAFADYARLLGSPRYAGVVGKSHAADFAQGLQKAGYATDPMYADKLMRIIGGKSLRSAMALLA